MYFYNEHFINLIVGVMVSLLASSAILQKWYLLLLTDWLTYHGHVYQRSDLSTYGLALQWATIIISSNVTCSNHDLAEKLLIWR
jgi:hypothetical protein